MFFEECWVLIDKIEMLSDLQCSEVCFSFVINQNIHIDTKYSLLEVETNL